VLLACAAAAILPASAAATGGTGGSDIVGGAPTSIEKWPWQVAIVSPPSNGGSAYERQRCGGVLVSRTAVVTAAHCVRDGGFQSAARVSVVTGRRNLSSNQGAEIPASDVTYFVDVNGVATPQSQAGTPAGPELYSESEQDWDVAVVRLSRPAPAPAAPIAVAAPEERAIWEPGDPVYATGWGDTTGVGGNYPDELREVQLRVIGDDDCGDPLSYGGAFHPATMVCAGVAGGGRDTCQGDSGGPLVAPAADGTFRLVGTTSFGDGCALAEKYGVYARVADATIRPALMQAIARAGTGPAPTAAPGAQDQNPPNTRLTSHPPRRTKTRVARFRWKSSETATFRCRIDGGPARICHSPMRKRVSAGRRHTFTLIARDSARNVERRSPRFHWRVVRHRHH
jgi:trypsin